VSVHPTPAERRFASSFFADTTAAGVRATKTAMRPDGRMDSWIWVAAIDTQTMLRLGILISDQLAGGVTDVVLDVADVVAVEKHGLGVLARIANQLREVRTHRAKPETRGTLTIEHASAEFALRLEPLVQCQLVTVVDSQPEFPSTPTSPEAHFA
jgi:hypothetical protein